MAWAAFVLKKVVGRLLMPLGLVLALGALALACRRRRPRLALGLALAAGTALWAYSLPGVGVLLLAPLERAAGDYADPSALAAADIRAVVVLSGGLRQGDLRLGDQLSSAALRRVWEGVRLYRGIPGARLVFSGGLPGDGLTEAAVMGRLAREMGVPAADITLEEASWDTEDQARHLAPLLDGRPFALVTSASHLPRALWWFRARGLEPRPAPCDFMTRDQGDWFSDWLPSAGGLMLSQIAQYEYLGLVWAWWRLG